jgi:hypothetical protein
MVLDLGFMYDRFGLHMELNPTWSVLQDLSMDYSLDVSRLIA